MTHEEARELLTGRIDDALDARARARLDAHLAECADCRRELDRLEGTVALLHGAPPVHAPAGFAERVAAAARPGRRRRLARALLHPLRVKLPLQAAALLVVALTVGLLYRSEPGLEDAVRSPTPAREDARPPAERATPHAQAPPSRERAPASEDARTKSGRVRVGAPDSEGEVRGPRTPAAPPGSPAPSAPARQETAAGDVVRAQWIVANRDRAVRDVTSLVARLGGSVLARQDGAEFVVLELTLPAGSWDAMARELDRSGRLDVDPGPVPAGPVRASLRIGG